MARALFGAAYTITVLITYTATLAYGLYPRLLSGGGGPDVEASIKLTTIFAVPALVGVATLAHPLLFILNPAYESAYPVLYILSIAALLSSYSYIFDSIITGTERVDARPEFTIKDLAKSRLFILPTLSYVHAVIGLPILYVMFNRLTHADLEMGMLCAMVQLGFGGIFVVARYKISKRCLNFRFPTRTVLTSLAASTVMSATLLLMKLPSRIGYMFFYVTVGAIVYFIVASIIDRETRQLVSRVLRNVALQLSGRRCFGLRSGL